jgi:ABC-2 type transport system ATP-binding protein
MKVKISLVRALLHDPAVLILDEFTLGLDPKSARDVRGIIKQLGKTVLLTTHNTLEAEEMAGRVAFMSKGRIVALGSAEELMSKVKQRMSVWVRFKDKGNAVKTLSSLGNITLREDADGKIEITFERDSMESLIESISRFGILEIETRRIGLEDAYLFYTGRALEEHA